MQTKARTTGEQTSCTGLGSAVFALLFMFVVQQHAVCVPKHSRCKHCIVTHVCSSITPLQKDAQLQRQLAQTAAAREQQQLYRAAKAIQCAWRSFNNQRIYRYYRDLIRFKEAGDPRQMLRCINAREAALVDPAAGLHVRFRLGGSSFPPLIFYRIYTHRPVAGAPASAPGCSQL